MAVFLKFIICAAAFGLFVGGLCKGLDRFSANAISALFFTLARDPPQAYGVADDKKTPPIVGGYDLLDNGVIVIQHRVKNLFLARIIIYLEHHMRAFLARAGQRRVGGTEAEWVEKFERYPLSLR